MKTTTKILLTITIILGTLITAATLTIDSIDTTETGMMVNFKDGTGYYIEKANKEAEPTFGVTNVLYESSEDFYLEPNEIGIEFSDGISWAIANLETNEYTFQCSELGDWAHEFDNAKDFENCIKTYISIKNTGSY